MRRFLFCMGLLGSVVLAFGQWPPEVLLHRQGDRPGMFYHWIERLGDWTGDGIGDFAVISVSSSYDTSVMDIWWGGASLPFDPDTTICWPDSVVCFQAVNTGDMTGDGIPDLLTGGGGDLLLFRGGRGQIEPIQAIRVDASTVAIPGDISGDGIPDMVVGDVNWNHARGRLLVYLGTPMRFVGPVDSLEGTQASGALGYGLTAGADMDGDGRGDFACTFNSWDTTTALFHPLPGDYLGDYDLFHAWWGGFVPQAYQSGRPALILGCIEGWSFCVHLGGDGLDTIPDAVLPIQDVFGGTPSYVGDVNADGWGDWVAGDDRSFGGLGSFLLFLGGPWISNYSYWMRGALGNPYWAMGKAMTGVGDVNGDGIDDFAMLCARDTNGYEGSQLVLFAGSESLRLAVDEKKALPANSSVVIQAFPNPFNTSTRIRIEGLRPGEEFELRIYNVLGQQVKYVHEPATANWHSVIWQANDELSGGIYFCHVNTSLGSRTVKLLLIR